MHRDFARLAALTQDQLWDTEAAQHYDSPGEGPFDETLLEQTTGRLADLAAGGAALEFAVGTGRVAIPLLRRGVPVVGIEASQAMITRLREKVDAERLQVIHGDMATTRVDGDFSLVYLVFNTIGNLLTQQAQIDCFRNAAAHLPPGGRFVIELWVPRFGELDSGRNGALQVADDGYVLVDMVDPVTQHLISCHFRFGDGPTAQLTRTPHRYIWPSELDLMARMAGFDLESRYADWACARFTGSSTSHVSTYTRMP